MYIFIKFVGLDYQCLMNFMDGSKHFDYNPGLSRGHVHILSPLVSDRMTRKWLAITSLPARRRRRRPVSGGRWPVTHYEGNPFTVGSALGPRPCVCRARTPSSICARGLPPSGPAGNRCRVLSRSCPAYVPCSCCDSTVLDCSRRCDGIERCATSSRAVLRPRADVSTVPHHLTPIA